MVMTEIYVDMVPYWKTSSWPRAFRGRSSVGLQERAFFGLTAFVMQCELDSRLGVPEPWLTSS
jgi:hypothetical protein